MMKTQQTASRVGAVKARLLQYRELGAAAIRQLDDAQLNWRPSPEDNSIFMLVRHLHGNMLSRFTDFLTSDGEKPWRDRDAEFAGAEGSVSGALSLWDEGWDVVGKALDLTGDGDLERKVAVRGEEHTVFEALLRQLAHYAYHVGQIVYLAKMQRGAGWKTLSIARGQSAAFNREMADRLPRESPSDSPKNLS